MRENIYIEDYVIIGWNPVGGIKRKYIEEEQVHKSTKKMIARETW